MRVSIRVSVVLWAVGFFVALGFGISRLLGFIHIFFEHAGITLLPSEAAAAHSSIANGTAAHNDTRVQYVPKIVHQVFHNWHEPGNDTLPADWATLRDGCKRLNPDFEFRLWTEKASRDFIETEYPWFLRTYDGYRFPVQRVDAVRYFILMHYGGIYMDLDNGCKRDLEPLLYYPLWVIDGARGALSNNILGSRPQHPFWHRLTLALIKYDYNYIFPYVTISYASGQWFETAIWEEYHALLPRPTETPDHEHRLYRLILNDQPGAPPWVFFTQERGLTWVNWDNRLFLLIGDHLILVALTVVGVVGSAIWLCVRTYRKHRTGYVRLSRYEI